MHAHVGICASQGRRGGGKRHLCSCSTQGRMSNCLTPTGVGGKAGGRESWTEGGREPCWLLNYFSKGYLDSLSFFLLENLQDCGWEGDGLRHLVIGLEFLLAYWQKLPADRFLLSHFSWHEALGIFIHPCPLLDCIKYPTYGIRLGTHSLYKWIKCVVYTHWSIIQPWRREKLWHSQEDECPGDHHIK